MKMDIQSEYIGTATSTFENVSFGKEEDSGYHTSTPSSYECEDISSQYFNPSTITNITISSITRQKQFDFNIVTPEPNFILYQPCSHSTAYKLDSTFAQTPITKSGVKRPYPNEETIETPTSFIAGKIKSLDVNENKENSKPSPIVYFDAIDRSLLLNNNDGHIVSYPSTPVKQNCSKQSPCRRSGKKILFATHSLSCETNGLQYSNKPRIHSKAVRNILFRTERKKDIISKLSEAQYLPPIENIFNYLSNKDIHNFCLVSKNWYNTWNLVSHSNKRKKAYIQSLKTVKENLENQEKHSTTANHDVKQKRYLKEIQNDLKETPALPGSSPPGTPSYNRFRKFTKSASLDSRTQIRCVRCNGPAKLTAETPSEMWAECKSATCCYKFCKDCSCAPHPGKCCSQYDLTCPSPSKRKKCDYSIGTKKSRKNLRRL